ncbi:hypothetical protein DSO57_1013980 [Entomophthora muscae]|uniref:Uncharacterized protein n=1 Tax=Entomophthora muscae TaxID=34485 RepID=A0ACC2RWX6_9FUNG|nr:hypothetical protein DSO57_1013980 [Entomophthora muscae]
MIIQNTKNIFANVSKLNLYFLAIFLNLSNMGIIALRFPLFAQWKRLFSKRHV